MFKFLVLLLVKFGFRNNHSTMQALTELSEKTRQSSDSRQFACRVFCFRTSSIYNMYELSSPSYREKSSGHHFFDDTSLLLNDKSLKKINKCINRDLKCAVD